MKFLLATDNYPQNAITFILFGQDIAIRAISDTGDSCFVTKSFLHDSGLTEKEVIDKAISYTASVQQMTYEEYFRMGDDEEIYGFCRRKPISPKRVAIQLGSVIMATPNSSSYSITDIIASKDIQTVIRKMGRTKNSKGVFLYPVQLYGKPKRLVLIPDAQQYGCQALRFYISASTVSSPVYYFNRTRIGVLKNVQICLEGSPERIFDTQYNTFNIA